MARNSGGRVQLPAGTKRRDGLVLGTRAKADRVDRSERLRAQMYALIEAHPETAEELLARAKAAIPQPLPRGVATGAPVALAKVPRQPPATRYEAKDTVPSPTVPGFTDHVRRVVTTIDHMRRRKQLGSTPDENEMAYRAAERIRHAFETIYGSVGGSMDFDRVRRAPVASAGPSDHYMLGAEVLRNAKTWLYPLDHRVVTLVAAEGYSLDEAAKAIRGENASRADKEEIGRALRAGLRALADHWWASDEQPAPPHEEIRIYRAPEARPTQTVPGVIDRGKTVHATGRRVFRNK